MNQFNSVAQLCLTLCDPMDCTTPGFPVLHSLLESAQTHRSLGQEDPLEKEMAPLQYSCLENPRDRGAWWADVYGVIQNRTRLKRLNSICMQIYLQNKLSGIELWGVKSESEVAQSCPTLSDPKHHSLPGSSVHGLFQARVLEWGAIAFSGIQYRSVQSGCPMGLDPSPLP